VNGKDILQRSEEICIFGYSSVCFWFLYEYSNFNTASVVVVVNDDDDDDDDNIICRKTCVTLAVQCNRSAQHNCANFLHVCQGH